MKSTAWTSIKKATDLRRLAGTTAFAFMTPRLSRFVTLYSQQNNTDTFTPQLYLVFAVIACPSVCPSVTSRYCIKTTKRRISEITPHDSPGTLVLLCKRSLRNSDGIIPNAAPNSGVKGKNCFFRPVEKSAAETSYRRKCVSIRHGGRWSASTTVRWRRKTGCHQERWW